MSVCAQRVRVLLRLCSPWAATGARSKLDIGSLRTRCSLGRKEEVLKVLTTTVLLTLVDCSPAEEIGRTTRLLENRGNRRMVVQQLSELGNLVVRWRTSMTSPFIGVGEAYAPSSIHSQQNWWGKKKYCASTRTRMYNAVLGHKVG